MFTKCTKNVPEQGRLLAQSRQMAFYMEFRHGTAYSRHQSYSLVGLQVMKVIKEDEETSKRLTSLAKL